MAKAPKLDPLFTDEANDYGPVGNDTGADVYGSYRAWRTAKKPAGSFLSQLLRGWEIPDRDWDDVAPDVVARQLKASPYERLVRDDTIIGLAFAQFLVDRAIDPAVRRSAMWAIERQGLDVVIGFRGWDDPAHRKKTLAKMRAFLESVSTTAEPAVAPDRGGTKRKSSSRPPRRRGG